MSINAKIAKSDGSVHWLESIPNPDKTDYGYSDFYDSIDATLQGNSTYQQILNWGIEFPYADKKNYVLTRNNNLKDNDNVQFISNDHIAYLRNLKKEKGQDIWLIGGGQVNSQLLKGNLIDELMIFIMPIIIDEGIDLFEGTAKDCHLQLLKTKKYSSGALELHYKVKK